jgi:aminoglycoside-2''-adenylyltransferase
MIAYEKRLGSDLQWALQEGSMHFEEGSAVHRSLRKIVTRLEALGIPYAVAGAMALFLHGFRRFTEDIDILVTKDGLQRIHAELEGAGYLAPFQGSKNLRDAESGVRIEFLVAGDFPGDGKPKPVAFPDPRTAAVEANGICWLQLPMLIELKLASGLTNPGRLKDLADVQELIRLLALGENFADQLNPFVRSKYLELWRGTQEDPMRGTS